MVDIVKNFAKVIVSTLYNEAATEIVLAGGHGAKLPATEPYNLVWWDSTNYPDPSDDPNVEIVRVTTRTTDTLTVTRAQEGTAATTKNTSDHTYKMILSFTKKGYDEFAPIASPTFTGTVTMPTGLTGVLRADSGVVGTDSDVTDLVDNLPYTKLADGTDGELITWDATGVPATVAVGTAGHVLTSNGEGAAPTFQASAGGAQLVNIWLSAEAAYLPATNPAVFNEVGGSTTYAGWAYLAFDDTTAQTAIWRVPVPDYNGGNIVVKAFSKPQTTPVGNVTLQYDILTIGLANDETFDTAVLVDTTINISHSLGTTTLSTEVHIASATIDPANVETDDLLVLGIKRDVASDDLSGNGQLLGILLEYTRA